MTLTRREWEEEAREAAKAADRKLAGSAPLLTRTQLDALFVEREDKKRLQDLIDLVLKETDEDVRMQKLARNLETVGKTALKVLVKVLLP